MPRSVPPCRRLPMARTHRFPAALAALLGLGLIAGAPSVRASSVGQTRKVGVGVVLGQPSGVTVKYHLTAMHAFAAQIGIGWLDGYHFRANFDYNLHITVARTAEFDIPIYFGAGLSLFGWFEYHRWYFWGGDEGQYRSQVGFGLRVPVGVSLNLNKVPLEAFGEIAGGFGFFPRLGGYLDGVVGVRYYF